MAGPLDFLTSDDAQMGLAMLAAAGPTATPMSFGQRLAGGMQQAAQTRSAREDRLFKQQLMQSQIAENQAQAAARTQQIELAAKKQAGIEAWLRGQGVGGAAPAPAGLLAGSEPSGGLLGPGGAAPGGGGGGFLASMTPDRLAQGAVLEIPGITGVAKAYELSRPDMVDLGGGYWADKRNLQPGVQPGAREAQLSLERDKGDITAGRQRIKYRDADGTVKEAWADQVDPRGPAAPPARAPAAPARNLLSPGGFAGGSSSAAAGGQAEVLTAELSKAQQEVVRAQQAGDAAAAGRAQGDIAAIQKELSRLPGGARASPVNLLTPTLATPAAGGPGVTLEASPQEQATNKANEAAAVKLAEGRAAAQVARETAIATSGRQFSQMTAAADMANKLLDSGPTGSGAGALADRVGNFVGQPLKGASQAAQLKALGGWLVSNVPRMEGPQSDRDVANYSIMAGNVGDDTLPAPTRKAALKVLIDLQTKYAAINGGDAPAAPTREFRGTVGAPGAAPAKPMTWEAAKSAGWR